MKTSPTQTSGVYIYIYETVRPCFSALGKFRNVRRSLQGLGEILPDIGFCTECTCRFRLTRSVHGQLQAKRKRFVVTLRAS